MDIFSKEKRSAIMSKIRSKNSKAELILRKALFSEGLRYRIHDKRVFGKPDVVFFKKKIAIFVDGDWWHGRNFENESEKYSNFWYQKISNNIERDKKVNNELKKNGWKVIRLWEKDLKKNITKTVVEIKKELDR